MVKSPFLRIDSGKLAGEKVWLARLERPCRLLNDGRFC